MACGWSPSLAHMLEQMALEKQQKAHDADAALQQTEAHVARVKQRADVDAQRPSTTDWTQSYARWDAWEDPEELARREHEARARQERAARSARAAGCDHDHSAEQKLMDMSTTAKLDACDDFRRLGNRFFAHGQYQRAAYHYHKALVYFEYVFPESDAETARHDTLKLTVLLNFAACRLKTNQLDDVVHHTTQALALDPTSVKALFRRAQAYRLRDNFTAAQADLTQATALLAHGANDPLVAQERQLLLAKGLAYKLRSKQVSSAMFQQSGYKPEEAKDENNDRDRPVGRANHGPDASVLRLRLATRANGSGSGTATPLASWQPWTLGLSQLKTVLAQLD